MIAIDITKGKELIKEQIQMRKMTADTSKLAYKQINEEGISESQKKTILSVVHRVFLNQVKRDISLREISFRTGIDINAVSGRVNELKKDGKLQTTVKRKCTITDRLVAPVIPIRN